MYPKTTKRQKITKRPIKDETTDMDKIPAPLTQLLSQIKNQEQNQNEKEVITKTNIDKEKGWRVTTIFEEVAFQIDDEKHGKSSEHDVFWWKFASELPRKNINFRGCSCNLAWYQAKELIEKDFAFDKVKQEKQGLCKTSLLAFRMNEWKNIKTKKDIMDGLHQPLQAHDVFSKDEQIVLMRLPKKIVNFLYKDVEVLTLDNNLTEEEKLQKVLDFDGGLLKPNMRPQYDFSKHPPFGYFCHNCGSPAHYVQNCDKGRRMRPKGIPKMFLEKTEIVSEKDNVLLLEDGTAVKARLLVDGKIQ